MRSANYNTLSEKPFSISLKSVQNCSIESQSCAVSCAVGTRSLVSKPPSSIAILPSEGMGNIDGCTITCRNTVHF